MKDMDKRPAIVVHGGAGGSCDDRDGCESAARRAIEQLDQGNDALAAAIAAVVALEDDGRFNAGTGAVLCLDGATIEMDAAIMDSRGRLGAVACLQSVKNPVLVARAVADSPHWLLCGEGARRFARVMGHHSYYSVTAKSRKKHQALMAQLGTTDPLSPGVDNQAYLRLWNYPAPPAGRSGACDTVGAVVRDADGHFAVAGSTGGTAPSLLGRVGDTPIIGSGFYAGPFGAVAATGIGEQIVRHLLAHTVYRWIADGIALEHALLRAVDLFAPDIDIGLVAVSRTEAGCRSNRNMPSALLQRD